ncbi:hypothetical protein CYMTET_16714 [Cymbomonas tetramitiformis]|uniref:Uncharacterized protein n=1 Tax=Cymbomonas tetramitiformis TaxID=36881 RepID=A0AAE0GBP3_9CHLO|nr:hypothetical protein CYMTET_16714 [Cymbomonas tetramitiformis]
MGSSCGFRDMLKLLNQVVAGESLRILESGLRPYFESRQAPGIGIVQWMEQLTSRKRARSGESAINQRTRLAWIDVARGVMAALQTQTPAQEQVQHGDAELFDYITNELKAIPINTKTSELLKLAKYFQRLPMISAFDCAPSWLMVHAQAIVAYFEYRANNVESPEDLAKYFTDTELHGLVIVYTHLMEQTQFIPYFVDATVEHQSHRYDDNPINVWQQLVTKLAALLHDNASDHAALFVEVAKAAVAVEIIANKRYTAIRQIDVRYGTPTTSQAILAACEPYSRITGEAARLKRRLDEECLRASDDAMRRQWYEPLHRHAENILHDLQLAESVAVVGVPFCVDDGDGISIYVRGERHAIRLAYIDSSEYNMAWDGQLPKLLLQAWREMGYFAVIDTYLYNRMSLWGTSRPQSPATRHIAVVRLVRPAEIDITTGTIIKPAHSFLAHEQLLQLGATRLYFNFLFVPSVQHIRELLLLVKNAKAAARDRARSIQDQEPYRELVAAQREKHVVAIHEANGRVQQRTDAALNELSLKSYAWRSMMLAVLSSDAGNSDQDDSTPCTWLSDLGRRSLCDSPAEWCGTYSCPVWLVETYKEPVIAEMPEHTHPVPLVLPAECFQSAFRELNPMAEFNKGLATATTQQLGLPWQLRKGATVDDRSDKEDKATLDSIIRWQVELCESGKYEVVFESTDHIASSKCNHMCRIKRSEQ